MVRFSVLRCLHAIDATRVHLTMKWVVSFSSLGRFGPSRDTAMLRAGLSIEISRGYGLKDFREDIKVFMVKTGVEGENVAFLFTDTQVVEESMSVTRRRK